jgi:hypothetical protein
MLSSKLHEEEEDDDDEEYPRSLYAQTARL